jgi:hypothetical protein
MGYPREKALFLPTGHPRNVKSTVETLLSVQTVLSTINPFPQQNTLLFLKRDGGSGEREKLFFTWKRSFPLPPGSDNSLF